jgi:hypothetical protein
MHTYNIWTCIFKKGVQRKRRQEWMKVFIVYFILRFACWTTCMYCLVKTSWKKLGEMGSKEAASNHAEKRPMRDRNNCGHSIGFPRAAHAFLESPRGNMESLCSSWIHPHITVLIFSRTLLSVRKMETKWPYPRINCGVAESTVLSTLPFPLSVPLETDSYNYKIIAFITFLLLPELIYTDISKTEYIHIIILLPF